MSNTRLPGALTRAQWRAQNSRTLPDLVNRGIGTLSAVGTEPFLDPVAMPWTALIERHYPAIRAEAKQVLRVRDALPNLQDIAPDKIQLTKRRPVEDLLVRRLPVLGRPELPALAPAPPPCCVRYRV